MKNDLYNKATKAENLELEKRVGQRSDENFSKLHDLFPDKDLIQKKLNRLDRQVSTLFLSFIFCILNSSAKSVTKSSNFVIKNQKRIQVCLRKGLWLIVQVVRKTSRTYS